MFQIFLTDFSYFVTRYLLGYFYEGISKILGRDYW